MTRTFTQNDLIRYIYDETSQEESIEIQQAVLCDGRLNEELNRLAGTKAMLDQLLETSSTSLFNSSRYKV